MEILFQLFLVLLLARLGGELFHHFDQPGSVGEILAGDVGNPGRFWKGRSAASPLRWGA